MKNENEKHIDWRRVGDITRIIIAIPFVIVIPYLVGAKFWQARPCAFTQNEFVCKFVQNMALWCVGIAMLTIAAVTIYVVCYLSKKVIDFIYY